VLRVAEQEPVVLQLAEFDAAGKGEARSVNSGALNSRRRFELNQT
jgi:hypothetical protein